MKIIRSFVSLIIVLVIGGSAGCVTGQQAVNIGETTPNETLSEVLGTSTLSGSQIVVSPTETSLVIATPGPTLTAEQREVFFGQLTREDCQTPCIFGIFPGETTSKQAKEVAQQLGAYLYWESEYSYEGSIFSLQGFVVGIGNQSQENHIDQHIYFYSYDGIVVSIKGDAFSPDAPNFYQYYGNYSLRGVMQNLGRPDQVLIQYDKSEGPQKGYGIALTYESLGIVVRNFGSYQDKNICPGFKEANVRAVDFRVLSFSEIPTTSHFGNYGLEEWHTISKSLGLSELEFYESLLNDAESCFQILGEN